MRRVKQPLFVGRIIRNTHRYTPRDGTEFLVLNLTVHKEVTEI